MVEAQGHFLAVEDDAVIRRAIERAARGLLPVLMAETGAGALALLGTGGLPRFVLLDYALPDLDGLEVLRRLRSDDRLRGLAVFMFSSLDGPRGARPGVARGAGGWVPQPPAPVAFHATIRALCSAAGAVGPNPG